MRGPRTQAQRDAATVETMYVVVSAVVFAGAAFLVVASPALVFDWVSGDARHRLTTAGLAAGGVTFLVRVVTGLWRW